MMNALKTFKDLLSFLTIIPLAKTEDFVFTSSRNMWLFPLMGGLIGLIGAGYFVASGFVVSFLLGLANMLIQIPVEFFVNVAVPAMTLAFLLVLTGFQHFDGLVDLGNAIGVKRVEDRREIAHRWVVTYKGGFLAIFVEFMAFVGIFIFASYLDLGLALRTIVLAEITAKLAMVTIVWKGKPAHPGLGARFLSNAKRSSNLVAYVIGFILGFILLGIIGVLVVFISVLFGLFMEWVGNRVFGGVSGDMIGATNEGARAITLVIIALILLIGVKVLLTGAFFV